MIQKIAKKGKIIHVPRQASPSVGDACLNRWFYRFALAKSPEMYQHHDLWNSEPKKETCHVISASGGREYLTSIYIDSSENDSVLKFGRIL